jgi:Flp pilus assembly protein TadG
MKKIGKSKGQALTEFALILPLLIVIVGGAVDFGLLFLVSNVVQNASREGVRVAVTLPGPIVTPTDPRIDSAVKAKYPEVGLFSGLTVTNTEPTGAVCQQDMSVTVSGVTYNYIFLGLVTAPLPLLGFPEFQTSVPIARTTAMRYESQVLCT